MKKIFLLISLLTLVILLFFGYFWYGENKSTGSLSEETLFVLEAGESSSSVAERLESLGAIDSKYIFLGHLAKNGTRSALQKGVYTLYPNDTPAKIALRMVNGDITKNDIRVTFPEGWPVRLMADRLTEKGLPGEEFYAEAMNPDPRWREQYAFLLTVPVSASLEGFLFPDTYQFAPTVTPDEIIAKMLSNFGIKVTPDIEAAAKTRSRSLFELITLASIVEEEGRTEADRKTVADVFWKRLAINQPFQSDATVNYVLGTFKEQPTFEDIETDSPYNTYQNAGLPPGPISNPSLQSIKAAAFPTPNPYYYFLNNLETKDMFFAETYEGHLKNREEQGL